MTANSGTPANRPNPPGSRRREADHVDDRLEGLLSDPIVQLLMERDGVEREVLLRMARSVRRRAPGANKGRSSPAE